MISLAETMEPHGRDGPVEEFMEDLIRGENERIDITQVFLNESGEGDESVGRREPAEEEVETGLYPSGHEESDGDGEAEVRCMHMYISTIPPLLSICTC
jgi:hypothetical protein